MKDLLEDHLTAREKTFIAMGAAMGAGCRTCADKLHEIAESLKIPESEMANAFNVGLASKPEAANTMKEKVLSLFGSAVILKEGLNNDKLLSFIRIASFTSSNSAPDAVSEIYKAQTQGATPEQIRICIALGKMVRKNAISYSDREISELTGVRDEDETEPCCPADSGTVCSCG